MMPVRWRALVWAVVLLAYALLVHYSNLGLLLWRSGSRIERHVDWLYLGQQCAWYAALALAFGRTLLAGQIPLCSRWAVQLRGPLDFETARYTRGITLVWTAFFMLTVGAIVVLQELVRRSIWSLLVNFLILAAAALLFVAEFLWRRRALPNAPHASLRDMAQLLR